jgi:8-oxo-dGTP diphosphatase
MTEAEIPALGERPAVSVDVVIFSVRAHDLQALLLRRPTPPFRGRWTVPGGFVRGRAGWMTWRGANCRQNDVHDVYLEQLYTFGAPERPARLVVSVAYRAGGERGGD